MSKLTGKTAIVTGGGSGIGRAIATTFASEGARVAIFDLDEDASEEAVQSIADSGGEALFQSCDVSDAGSVEKAVAKTLESFGRIDVLVNNAGVANIGTATNTTEEDFDRVMRVNVKGVFQVLRAVLPKMVDAGGGVVLNMSSVAAITGLKDRFAYSASKGAVHTMTFSIASDYLEDGIRCNAICPARVHTPFVDGYLEKNYPDTKEEMFEKLSKVQPIGRMCKPEEVAGLALFLCGEDSAYITGQAYEIDGGYMKLR